MPRIFGIALVLVVSAIGSASAIDEAAAASAAKNLPLKDPKGLARVWQANINRNWDPAGRCRVLTRYSVRCAFTSEEDMRMEFVMGPTPSTVVANTQLVRCRLGERLLMSLGPKHKLYPYV